MIVRKKQAEISEAHRIDSAVRKPESALPGFMHHLSVAVLVCALIIGATGFAVTLDARSGNLETQAAAPISGVIGKVQSFNGTSIDVQTPAGVVHVEVKQPLTTYKQVPSDLSHVTNASYVGVASTQQADGKEVAKQIIIFPAELSGAAEGSVLTDPPGATTHSRMTNGSVSRPAASHSRMTNGTVQKSSGTTLVVQYQDGSKTISVPGDVPVTLVAPEQVTFSNGDVIYASTEKLANGTLVTDKIFLFIPAASASAK